MGKENVTFSIGGKLAPSYKGALSQAVAEAQAANARIASGNKANSKLQSILKKKIDNVDSQIASYQKDTAEYRRAVAEKTRLEERLLGVQNAGFTRIAREKQTVLERTAVMEEKAYAEREAAAMAAMLDIQAAEHAAVVAAKEAEDAKVAAAAVANADKVEMNRAALANIMAQEREQAIVDAALQDAEIAKQVAAQEAEDAKVAAAAVANAEKVEMNRAALDTIMAQEREQATIESALQDAEIAKRVETETAKVAANQVAMDAIMAKEKEEALLQQHLMAEEMAAREAAEMERLSLAARGRGLTAPGHAIGGHGGGGFGGIVREGLVIIREVAMGRGMSRVGGSLTLMAQYMGALGKILKSTAQDALQLAEKEVGLYQAMAKAAVVAKANAVTDAELAAASELRVAALAQEKVATEAATAAEMELQTAKVALNPLGWVLIAGAVIIATLVGIAYHMHKVAVETANAAKFLGRDLKVGFLDVLEAQRDGAEAHEQYVEWLDRLGKSARSAVKDLENVTSEIASQAEAEMELMRAKGESEEAIQKRKEKELDDKIAAAEEAKKKAEGEIAAMRGPQGQNWESNMQAQEDALKAKLKAAQEDVTKSEDAYKEVDKKVKDSHKEGFMKMIGKSLNPFWDPKGLNSGSKVGVETEEGVSRISLNEAKVDAAHREQTYEAIKAQVDRLKDYRDKVKKHMEDAGAAVKSASEALAKLEQQKKLNPIHEQVAALNDKKKDEKSLAKAHSDLVTTQREHAGIYSSVYSMKMHDTAKEQLKTLKTIAKNTSPRGGGGSHGQTNFGGGSGRL